MFYSYSIYVYMVYIHLYNITHMLGMYIMWNND